MLCVCLCVHKFVHDRPFTQFDVGTKFGIIIRCTEHGPVRMVGIGWVYNNEKEIVCKQIGPGKGHMWNLAGGGGAQGPLTWHWRLEWLSVGGLSFTTYWLQYRAFLFICLPYDAKDVDHRPNDWLIPIITTRTATIFGFNLVLLHERFVFVDHQTNSWSGFLFKCN